jgi:hypothetical protein
MSGAPEDSNANLSPSGKSRGNSTIIHRTVRCTPDSVRCSNEERPQELASFRKLQQLLCYNSPDMSGVHWTVRCNCVATATSRQRSPATAINARQSAQKSGTRVVVHRTLYSTCPVRHRTSRRAHQTASLVVGAINTPNHPTFKASKFSTSQPLTRARQSILDTPKRSNPLQFHTRL